MAVRNLLPFILIITAGTSAAQDWRKWLEEDVTYIITDQEHHVYELLSTAEDRDQFIEQFWLLRDPTPETPENEYKQEHYRRIDYANQHFASKIAGWKTDRGRIYIMYGSPDEIEAPPGYSYPVEHWHYRYIAGVGRDVQLAFVDPAATGDFTLSIDAGPLPSRATALQFGQKVNPGDGVYLDSTVPLSPAGMAELGQLESYAKSRPSDANSFPDLERTVASRFVANGMPMHLVVHYLRLTGNMSQVNISLAFGMKSVSVSTLW